MTAASRRTRWAALAVAFLLPGCGEPKPVTPEGLRLLERGKLAYRAGDNPAAIQDMSQFLTQFDGSAEAVQAFYYRARARFNVNDFAGARADALKVLGATEDPQLLASAEIVLGNIEYNLNNAPAAEQHYTAALTHIPDTAEPADYALFWLAATLQREGKWEDADLKFDRLIFRFPHCEWSDLARKRIRGRAWTVQLGAFESRPSADQAAENFRQSGLDAQVVRAGGQDRVLFRVQSGRFDNYDRAVASMEALPARPGDAFVTVTR